MMVGQEPVAYRPKLSAAKQALLEKRLRGEFRRPLGTPAISRRLDPRTAPLSFAQQRLWFFHQLEPESPLYNISTAVRLRGRLNHEALQKALTAIVGRHESLRARFVSEEGNPGQIIDPPPSTLKLSVLDLSGRPPAQREATIDRILQTEASRPFNLSTDLMLRAVLGKLDETDHVLLLAMHHIASDGWSLGVLFRELTALYEAFDGGRPPSLSDLPIQYSDYALWQRQWLEGEVLEDQLEYWKHQLAGAPDFLDLPTDRPRPAIQTFRGHWRWHVLPRSLCDALKILSQQEGATLFMTVLAAFKTLLHRYSGQEDILVGSPIAGRNQIETEGLIGFFINTLVLRGDLSGDPTFRELLHRVREVTLEAYAHQDLPFDKLVEALRPERSSSHSPLVQVMFVLQNMPALDLKLPQLTVTPVPVDKVDTGTAKFDLMLQMEENERGLTAAVEYNSDLFDAATINRLLGHFQTLLEGIVADPDQRLSELPLLTPAERNQLLIEWNDTRTGYPRHKTIPELFSEQVAKRPDVVAVRSEDGQLTYRELNARANQLANFLNKHGVGPDVLVGVCMERSLETIVALLGILKAGGAYVSLDPSYPKERLGGMLEDSLAPVVLTQEKLRGALPDLAAKTNPNGSVRAVEVVSLDTGWPVIAEESAAAPPSPATPDNLAYVSYTSGSTGKPKGVCVPQRGVVRLVTETNYACFGSGEVFLQLAPIAFDASTLEIWGPLLNGGQLVVFPPRTPSLAELGEAIRKHQITTLWLTSGLFNQTVEEQLDSLKSVRQLLAGGDVLSVSHVARALGQLSRTQLINGYGPTENTTFTCCHQIVAPLPPNRSIPIGRPVSNTRVYILDAHLQPVPIGVPGELFIGGDGLARGYLNRPKLTAEKFIGDPFSDEPGARLYRTGDRARWLPGGVVEFLGRIDRQVKIRGFRIELEEIEIVLALHPAVKETVVMARKDHPGEKRLVAYVVAAGQPPPAAGELRRFLQQKLPDHMVPSAFLFLDALPLNTNGKVDRHALPMPDSSKESARESVAPRDEVESRLAGIWEDVLDVRPVGVHDNFFELGGHSLLAVRLIARIGKSFGRKLSVATIFQTPTVGQLAVLLRENKAAISCSSLVAIQAKGSKPPIFFIHGVGGGNLWTYANLAPHLEPEQPVYGLESRGMRGLEEFERIEEMAAHYIEEIRTVQPHGPYYLGGYCFGGNVAYEVARQLRAQSEAVALLALLDSAPSNADYGRIPWWRPSFVFNFVANTFFWLADFFELKPEEQRDFVQRKFRVLKKRILRRIGREAVEPQTIDLEDIIDVARFPEIELKLWDVHLRALRDYVPQPYPGRVTLFRTRGQPFLCSFDPQFGWGALAAGGVEVVPIPGSHEKIFMEPHVRALAAKLKARLNETQAGMQPQNRI
jgi:aspartate racemase